MAKYWRLASLTHCVVVVVEVVLLVVVAVTVVMRLQNPQHIHVVFSIFIYCSDPVFFYRRVTMAFTTSVVAFLGLLLELQSLPLFGAYLLMIALSGLWQQKVPAVTSLRPVSTTAGVSCNLFGFVTLFLL